MLCSGIFTVTYSVNSQYVHVSCSTLDRMQQLSMSGHMGVVSAVCRQEMFTAPHVLVYFLIGLFCDVISVSYY